MKRTAVVVGLGLIALALGLIGCGAPCDCPDDATSYIKPPPPITEEDIQRGREELSDYGGVAPPAVCELMAEHDWDELKFTMAGAASVSQSRAVEAGEFMEEMRAFNNAVFSATHSDAWGEWLADQRGGDLPTTVLEVIWIGTLTNERAGRVMQALCES